MMYYSPHPMGHHPAAQTKLAAMTLQAIQVDLNMLKRVPILDPSAGMVDRYLDCLNKLLEPMMLVHGPSAMVNWLHEIQHFMMLLRQRAMTGIPLTGQERHVIQWYSARWKELRGGAFDMGRPEAQLVLISLAEQTMY